MVPPASHEVPRVSWYSGYRFGSHVISPTGLSPSMGELSISFGYHIAVLLMRSYNPANAPPWKLQAPTTLGTPIAKHWRFGLFPFRSSLLRESRLISFPPGTEIFHFPGFAPFAYVFSEWYLDITPGGLPHSEIHGSTDAYSSPWLIAVSRVLHRPLMPRHPP